MQLDLPFLRADTSPGGPLTPQTTPGRARPVQERVEFVRMRRARRYILRVRPDGTLRVTVPRGGSRREAQAFVEKSARWIERERRRVRAEHAPVEWHAGSEILFRGVTVTIAAFCHGDGYVISYGNRRLAVASLTNLRDVIERDLRELAHAELIPRLHELAAAHDLRVGRVTIRNQRSRWGSCARTGNITLNFRLMQMPVKVRDYVLIHELMHIRQQNHSRRFWRLVASACPTFRESERWLRTIGRGLF